MHDPWTPLFPWTASEHRVRNVGKLREAIWRREGACFATIDLDTITESSLIRWEHAVGHAALDFASSSGADRAAVKRQRAVLTDVTAIRTGCTACPPSLLQHVGTSSGFVRGLYLVEGTPQRLSWFPPHPAASPSNASWRSGAGGAAPGDLRGVPAVTLTPGSLWFHHASMPYEARTLGGDNESDGALWLTMHVWYINDVVSGAEHATSRPKKGKRRPAPHAGRTHTLWHTAVATITVEPLRQLGSLLRQQADHQGLSDAAAIVEHHEREQRSGAEHPGTSCAGGPSVVEIKAPALSKSALVGSTELALASLARSAIQHAAVLHPGLSLSIIRAFHLRLDPRVSLLPRREAWGLVRALFVLSAPDDVLQLRLLDPRPPSVRMPGLSRAEWPFGFRNVYLKATVPNGTLLLLPAALEYSVAALEGAGAHWVELHVGPSAQRGAEPDAPLTPALGRSEVLPPLPPSASVPRQRWPPAEGVDAETSAVHIHQEEAPAGLFWTAPSHTQLHPTLMTSRWRNDAPSLAAIAKAAAVVRRHARERPSANVSNVGGWQSAADYLMEERAVFEPLYPIVYSAIIEYLSLALPAALAPHLDVRLTGWANANRRGHSNDLHDHADQDWALSGVLYLDSGKDRNCRLTLRNPWPAVAGSPHADGNEREARHVLAAPSVAGQVVVFPSWVEHWVPPHCGPRQRLSVAFNAAALLPSRRWPDGERSTPVPKLAVALSRARDEATQRRLQRFSMRSIASSGRLRFLSKSDATHIYELWPVVLTAARVAPSAAIDAALQRKPASTVDATSECTSECSPDSAGVGETGAASQCTSTPSPYPRGSTAAVVCPRQLPAARSDDTLAEVTRPVRHRHRCCLRIVSAAILPTGCETCWARALLQPIAAIVHASLTYEPPTDAIETGGKGRDVDAGGCGAEPQGLCSAVVIDAEEVALGSVVDAPLTMPNYDDTQPGLSYIVSGAFIPPTALGAASHDEANKCARSRHIALSDTRLAAGDLASHMASRERLRHLAVNLSKLDKEIPGEISAPTGTVFACPSHTQLLIRHHVSRCAALDAAAGLLAIKFRVHQVQG